MAIVNVFIGALGAACFWACVTLVVKLAMKLD